MRNFETKINKLILIFIMTCFITKLLGQDTPYRTVVLKQAQNSSNIASFDSILFKSDKKEISKIFTNVIASDSAIKLRNIPIGKYTIEFTSFGKSFKPLDVIVCSKCDNEFEYCAVTKADYEKPVIWTVVTEYPHYDGGKNNLAKDFQNSLSKSDRKILMNTANIIISFCVTKNNEVCDISFNPENLPSEAKKIITKGILSTNKWKHGRQQGEPSNEIYTIDKATLMEN